MSTPTTAEPQYTVSQGAEVAKEFTGTSNGATIRMGFEILKLRATIARLEVENAQLLKEKHNTGVTLPVGTTAQEHQLVGAQKRSEPFWIAQWRTILPGAFGRREVAVSYLMRTVEYCDELRTRADAAERRVEAVAGEKALAAAAKAAFAERTGADPSTATPDEIDQYIEIADATIRAALAAASEDNR